MKPTILRALNKFTLPISYEKWCELELNVIQLGCMEALVIWKDKNDKNILVDGHKRYAICEKRGIHFRERNLKLNSLEDVKDWMLDQQLSKNNLSVCQLSYFRGLKYSLIKRRYNQAKRIKNCNFLSTKGVKSELLADQYRVSERTIRRDFLFSKGIDLIGTRNPELRTGILIGLEKVSKADVELVGKIDSFSAESFKSREDLLRTLNLIKLRSKKYLVRNIKEQEQIATEAKKNIRKKYGLRNFEEEQLDLLKSKIQFQINICVLERSKKSFTKLDKLINELRHLVAI